MSKIYGTSYQEDHDIRSLLKTQAEIFKLVWGWLGKKGVHAYQ